MESGVGAWVRFEVGVGVWFGVGVAVRFEAGVGVRFEVGVGVGIHGALVWVDVLVFAPLVAVAVPNRQAGVGVGSRVGDR